MAHSCATLAVYTWRMSKRLIHILQILDDVGRKAKDRGLTPEILDSLLLRQDIREGLDSGPSMPFDPQEVKRIAREKKSAKRAE
jgi:hypothetical protein